MRQFAVIGLGRFGMSLAKTLADLGHEVLAVDISEKKVQEASEFVTDAVQADATDSEVLKELGLSNFDVVIVALAENMQASILATIILKEMGVKTVVSKAADNLHGRILEKIGADKVVFPERDMGEKLAHSLATENVLDHIDLSADYGITEFRVSKMYAGKTLQEVELNKKFKLTVVLIKKQDRVICVPGSDSLMEEGDILLLVGANKDLRRFEKEQEKAKPVGRK